MSWSITINGLQETDESVIPGSAIEQFLTQHPKYAEDCYAAYRLAKSAGLGSAVLTGGRTPNPYGDDEVVDISVRGVVRASDYNAEMQRIIRAGPQPSQAIPPDYEQALAYLVNMNESIRATEEAELGG